MNTRRMVDTLPWHDSALLAGSDDEPQEPLTEAERAAEFSEFYFTRLDQEADLFGRIR